MHRGFRDRLGFGILIVVLVRSVVKDIAWRRNSAHTTRRRAVGTIMRALRRGRHAGGPQVKGSTTFFGEVDYGNFGSEHPAWEAN